MGFQLKKEMRAKLESFARIQALIHFPLGLDEHDQQRKQDQ